MKLDENTAENKRLFGCAIGARVMPAAICSDKCVSLFRPPSSAFVAGNREMVLEDPIDHLPCGFNCILACEERTVALHGIAQKPM